MIRTALEFISSELEAYFIGRDPVNYKPGHVAAVQPMVRADGNLSFTDDDHISIMLIGMEEERREGLRPRYTPTDDQQFLRHNPPVEVALYVLFAAHNSVYETALRDLSNVLSFFQAFPLFNQQKSASLNAAVTDPAKKPWQLIERLSFSLYNMTFEQQNNLWGMIGTKYLPNVIYKVNMLTVFDTRSNEKVPAVTELNLTDNS